MVKRKIEDEINFADLLKNPVRLFGIIIPLTVISLLALGIYYVKHLDYIGFNKVQPAISDTTNIVKDIELKKGGFVPAVNLEKVSNPTVELVAKGKELYDANCQSCHGAQGKGDGPAGAALNPKPRDFHATDGWTNGRDIENMFKTLQEGIAKNGMASYEYMPIEDRFAIIHYIRTMDNNFPEITPENIKNLDQKYQLSKDVFVPHNIPVAKAKNIMEKETESYIKSVELTESELKVLKKISDEPLKIVSEFKKEERSFNEFVKIVTSNPFDYGFNSNVLKMNEKELQNLFTIIYKKS